MIELESKTVEPVVEEYVDEKEELKPVRDTESVLWPRIKSIVVQTGLQSTTHGIPNIFRTRASLLKAAWVSFLIGATIGCAYVNTVSVVNYLDYDVITTIQTLYQNPSQFPMISICNENSLISSAAIEFSQNYLSTLNTSSAGLSSSYYSLEEGDPAFTRFLVTMMSADPIYNDSFRQSLTVPFNQTIRKCFFDMHPCNADDDFEWYYSVRYGNCQKFNSGKNSLGLKVPIKECKIKGEPAGFSLMFINPQPTSVYSYSNSYGATILISNQSELMSFDKGFTIPVGAETKVSIRRELVSRQAKPYSDCVRNIESSSSSILVKYFVENGLKYKKQDCLGLCYQRKVVDTCGCYSFLYPMTFDKPPCTEFTDYMCSSLLYNRFFKEDATTNCTDDCPQECESISYQTSASYLDFPSDEYAQVLYNRTEFREYLSSLAGLSGNLTMSEWYSVLKKNIISLIVYYDELSYTFIEETPKFQITDLISSIGGTIGLFLGMSFLSFCELFEMAVEIILMIFEQRRVGSLPL